MSHPRDEWVELRNMGDDVSVFLLARDGREIEIAEAKAEYVHDRIDVAELERRIGEALA